ncbi:FAM172 family protein homolog CG10038 isoform X2 [Drosophila sulfurigaster albostrigata]|uniref:FAM172 family protein homolog CG10038 isoform X2 n=2 Tax=Drosophila sulfurigaster albostrigata TaxID=89887 RepID=UPI002D21DBEC|nr:FAM172 family protein homolog CG10038 isoform X2 [Drosophila sulfurigaster albostrigata]
MNFAIQVMAEPKAVNSQEAIARLREFGYGFTEDGKLHKIDPATGEPGEEPFVFQISEDAAVNREHYDKLANQIPEIVYELLEKNGLQKTYLPLGMPIERSTFVFTQPQPISKSKKLLVLINGSGYVLAGQWARKLIINNSLDHGTQLPYIKRAQQLGYDILVTNTNDNAREIKGKLKPIKGLDTAFHHASYVWENVVIPSNPENVAIVAHSFGASIARYLTENYTDFFKEKVFAIALTDGTIGSPPASCKQYFIDVACNWASSNEPLDTDLRREQTRDTFRRVSAGHPEHEWSSYSAMESIFKFFEDKYEQRVGTKNTSSNT